MSEHSVIADALFQEGILRFLEKPELEVRALSFDGTHIKQN